MSVCQGGHSKPKGPEGDAYRLPTNVYPTHYDLIFKTDLEGLIFEGQGIVHLDVKDTTKNVIFNFSPSVQLKHLSLKNASGQVHEYQVPTAAKESEPDVNESNNATEDTPVEDLSKVGAGQVLVDKAQERIALGVPESWTLEKDSRITLHATWVDTLGDSMMGYYKSTWKKDGKDAHYALTQFEPTAARRAYPSWDEPKLKSTYTIAMVSRKGLVNLSNMPAESEQPWTGSVALEGGELGDALSKTEGEWIVTKFEKTPLISSYLVAWANGEFVHLDSEYKSPLSGKTVPLRIYTTPELIHQAQFALDVKAKALPVYEEIFDIEYPLPKLDTLGAMENWGLITGRTSVFLWDPKKSSLAAKKRVIDVQSHECAHMWFGNVVSPEWWTYLWLNEAFATLMGEVIIPDKIFPEFNVRQEFLTGHLASALGLDAVRSSHPIEVDCPDANKVNQIFDSISYSKGASVLRMLSAVVGEDKFLKGVSIYLKKLLYGNSVTEDLWDGISEASGVDVAKIMKEWTLKVGFPVITVEEVEGGKIKVRQNRFLNTGDVKPEEDETLWYVPLELKTVTKDGKSSIDHKAILHEREATFDVGDAKAFKLNAETVGVYRVAYSAERLLALGEEAAKKESGFTTEDRIGLVSDAMTLARAGYSKTSGGLNLISKLSGEQEFRVWDSIAASLGKLKAVWWEQPEEVRNAFDKFRAQLFRPVAERLGWKFAEGEDPATAQLRALAIGSLAGAEDAAMIQEIQKRFQPFLTSNDDSQIPADVQRTIFTIAVRHGGEAEYKKIREVYDNPPNPSTKIDALLALGATKDTNLIKKTFTMLDDGSVLDQDLMYAFVALSSNRLATRDVAKYFKDNYSVLMKRFGDNFGISRLVTYAFNSLTTKEDLADITAFFEGKKTDKYKMALAQTKDTIQASISWLERDREDVEKWLKDNNFLN
ncbi:Aminopeptidase 2 mitochondrial [Naganishia albida]|nr:Aminopeptidase 2 mitochondrial [Naganishia albida]